MQGLWTNRNGLSDFVRNGFQQEVSDVYIAVAFFTESAVIESMLEDGCHIKMIVRLGFPTNPEALKKNIDNDNIDIRYYTGHSFHPKLYIFGSETIFVGSANLTAAALQTNQEIVISVEPNDPRFDELKILFSEYWDEAKVLTQEDLDSYAEIFNSQKEVASSINKINKETKDKLGDSSFSNIKRVQKKKTKKNIFIDDYNKIYQETVSAFKKIEKVYLSTNKRKNNIVPIRIEIDSFISFVRDKYATTDKWNTDKKWGMERENLLLSHIEQWFEADYPHFQTVCNKNYPLINKIFKSESDISASTYENIIDALIVLHSFHDRLRFFGGGLDTLIKTFKENDINLVKKSLSYLLFGDGDIVARMANLIYTREYKIDNFGQSNVQELVGWVNQERLPVINGRTTKILKYYGFDVKQL